MKIIFLISILPIFLTSCFNRIGDLSMVSNGNFDTGVDYVLIQKNVEGKAKVKKGDPLEEAIDRAVQEAGGDHLRNCKIYVKNNGKKIKVVGDVWGNKAHVKPEK